MNDPEVARNNLQDYYEKIKNIKTEQIRGAILCSLSSKNTKLAKILCELPSVDTLKKEYEETLNLANYILLNMHNIKPYEGFVIVEGKRYSITPRPKTSMISDELFSKCKKLKQKIKNIGIQRDNLAAKISFLDNHIEYVKNADINELRILRQRKESVKYKSKYYESFFVDGVKVSVGRNKHENIRLLKEARADFIWLHIKNIPSSHMVVHKSEMSEQLAQSAGTLLARLNGINDSVEIDYTKRKFVKICNESNVIYSRHRTLYVRGTVLRQT